MLARMHFRVFTLGLLHLLSLTACGEAQDFDRGEELAPAVLGGAGAGRVQSGSQVDVTAGSQRTIFGTCTVKKPKAKPIYDIVPVTMIETATSGIPGWANGDLPFTGAPVTIGTAVADGQTPVSFAFDYPANNFQLSTAHVVVDTSRDTSDTEAIFVDGVFTGRPPLAMVNGASTKISDAVYFGGSAPVVNTYYIDFAIAHYKRLTRNTFDLELAKLLEPATLTSAQALADGALNVVTGDDSPVYQAYLVIKGLTIADGALTCSESSHYTFTNVYLHNDGNTVGQSAFSGTVGTPYSSWSSVGTYASFDMNFDAPLPQVDTANIGVTTAKLAVTAKKNVTGTAAIVINGIGVSQAGFDRTAATAAVERWDDNATAAFETFMASVSTAAGGSAVELNFLSLFDAATVRSLLAQGKLNISVAGNLYLSAQAATSTRGFGTAVAGPELKLDGTYFTQVCQVQNNPDSPLTQSGIVDKPTEYEDVQETCELGSEATEGSTTVLNDGSGPAIGSLQALEITSNAASIVWSTDEGSTSEVHYGIGNTGTTSAVDSTMTTFHKVRLTGLSPYKFYNFQVVSYDKYGNKGSSDVVVFTTLR